MIRNYMQLILMAMVVVWAQGVAITKTDFYTIPYPRYFDSNRWKNTFGCNSNIVYGSYTYPEGLRDAAHIATNIHSYGGGGMCIAGEPYLKVFGYAQNYDQLAQIEQVVNSIKVSTGRFKSIILDWKHPNMLQSASSLNMLIDNLQRNQIDVHLKLQASVICKELNGQPFIRSVTSARKVIVEMYGESPSAYKMANQIFFDTISQDPTSSEYPSSACPFFPSYTQLKSISNSFQFFIQKTLQPENDGYLGGMFDSMLVQAKMLYEKPVFYDAYPPNIIRL